jgi:hypothetical protein
MTKKTEWIFACNANGSTIPTLIRFVTDKSSDEIQQNYSDNAYDDKSGKVAVSLWYCDEYTEEYSNYGHECADCGWASKSAYDIDNPVLKVLNLDAIPVVDLDVELKKPKVKDTGYYDGWVW